MAFPTPHSEHGFAPKINIKEFTKPKGVKVIGLVFFGRRNRVEMLKCFIEVQIWSHIILAHRALTARLEKPGG
jgi:hypothetical protein